MAEVSVSIVVRAKDEASKVLAGIGGQIQKHSKTLKVAGFAMAGAAAGIGVVSMKMAADFEGAMREVNSMMGLGQDQFKSLSDQVLQTAKDVGKGPEEMARALYQVISAGVPAGEAIEFLATSAKASIAGVTDVTTAVDGLTTVINAFGFDTADAGKISDIFFTTIKGGKTTMEELSASLFQVAPIAAASGIEFETVAAALATMTKQGVPTKIATTQLRQAMVSLQKPGEDMKVAIEQAGFATGQAMIAELGFAESLDVLSKQAGGNNEVLMKMFGSIEAGAAVLALTGKNSEAFQTDLKAMANATEGAGAATEAYNEINKGAGRQFEMLKANMEGLTVQIGQALLPAIIGIVTKVTPVIEKIAVWIGKNPVLTATLIAVTFVLGSLLLVLGFLPAIIAGVTAAAGAMGAVFAVIFSPITLIILAIGALIAIGVLLWRNWEKVVSFLKKGGVALLIVLGPIGAVIGGIIALIAIIKALQSNWEKVSGAIKLIWEGLKMAAMFTFKGILSYILLPFRAILEVIRQVAKAASGLPFIGGTASKVAGFANTAIEGMKKVMLFQGGGIVTRPTLGMIGEAGPEAVIPLSKAGSALGGVAGKTEIHLHVGVMMGDREDSETFLDMIQDGLRNRQRMGMGVAVF